MTRSRFLAVFATAALAPAAVSAAVQSAEAPRLPEAYTRAMRAAKDAGVRGEDFLYHLGKARQITSRSSEVICHALATIYTRAQRQGHLCHLTGAEYLENIARWWPRLMTPVEKTSVAECLGGVYHVNIVRALFS